MALFKFRKAGGDEPVPQAALPESVETLRRRARHRLIGASVLVLLGVVGFPLLFDTQPRPIAVDIPIEIPDRNKVKPLAAPAPVVSQAPVATGAVSAPAATAAVAKAPAEPAAAAASKPAVVANAEPKAEPPKPEPKVEAKPEPKPETKVVARPADGDRARALLEGKPVQVSEGRFVVQVGAFSDNAKAREARMKVERSGIKTLVQVVETKDGPRTRVRVGPFSNRAEAEKAAEKIKGLDLPAAILTL